MLLLTSQIEVSFLCIGRCQLDILEMLIKYGVWMSDEVGLLGLLRAAVRSLRCTFFCIAKV